jgi:hypothetical protein
MIILDPFILHLIDSTCSWLNSPSFNPFNLHRIDSSHIWTIQLVFDWYWPAFDFYDNIWSLDNYLIPSSCIWWVNTFEQFNLSLMDMACIWLLGQVFDPFICVNQCVIHLDTST